MDGQAVLLLFAVAMIGFGGVQFAAGLQALQTLQLPFGTNRRLDYLRTAIGLLAILAGCRTAAPLMGIGG